MKHTIGGVTFDFAESMKKVKSSSQKQKGFAFSVSVEAHRIKMNES
jgi:hypothetical protein